MKRDDTRMVFPPHNLEVLETARSGPEIYVGNRKENGGSQPKRPQPRLAHNARSWTLELGT